MTTRRQPGTISYSLINIPPLLWLETKVLSARRGETIRELILSLLIKEIRGEENWRR